MQLKLMSPTVEDKLEEKKKEGGGVGRFRARKPFRILVQ